MAKFPINRFPAGFFDLAQDISRELPLDLIERWTHSDYSQRTALDLLAPHVVSGTVVSTDAAGLTSLTRERGLVEILAQINGPKEIVHACGKAAGGQAIGIWAADNTQMFYPSGGPERGPAEPSLLLSMLLETMDRVHAQGEVPIGACIHTGDFFQLGGGLYGRDADRVEKLAEEHAGEHEILVTGEFLSRLAPPHPFSFEERVDLRSSTGNVWRISDGPRLPGLVATDFRYPHPYAESFYELLRSEEIREPRVVEAAHERYATKRTIAVVEREGEDADEPEIAVLNDLSLSAAMARIARGILRVTGGQEVKSAANLAIYSFEAAEPALDFSRRLRRNFREQGVAVRIGIAEGQVFVFDLGNGRIDIAGMPVNLACKVAQDRGRFGHIYLTRESAAAVDCGELEHYSFQIAGVDVEGWVDSA
jgi:class 3 adenylate cyclase